MTPSLSFDKTILGILAHPVIQSFSPFIHNLAAELTGKKLLYLPFDVPKANLKDALKGVVALGIAGFNVSIPHKELILTFLDDTQSEASIIGAVNTVVNDHGRLIGYNTDVDGINATLLPYLDKIKNRPVAIIGSGGASRTLIYTLLRNFNPSEIHLINRTEQKAELLTEYFRNIMKYSSIHSYELFPHDIVPVIEKCKLIVNTTPIGMWPDIDDAAITIDTPFNNSQIVFDMVYNPIETKLLSLAARKGAQTINGLKMLVMQAAKSFELWTGTQMPTDQVYQALLKEITIKK